MRNIKDAAQWVMNMARRCQNVENNGIIEMYAIQYNGHILPHTIYLGRSNSLNERSASWWEENANKAKIVKLHLTIAD